MRTRVCRAPLLHSLVIAISASNGEAYSAARRLATLVEGSAAESLCQQLALLEEGLRVRVAEARDAAAKPGADGASVVRALEAEARSLGVRLGAGERRDSTDDALPQGALEQAGRTPIFRQINQAVLGCSLNTAAGRLTALGSSFNGLSPLTTRMLMDGSETLAKSHSLLETLRGLRPFVGEYLEYVLTVDVRTGSVPHHLARFSLAAADGSPCTFVAQLLKFGTATVNWLDPPHGMLGLKAAREQNQIAVVHAADHYCQPELLDDLGPFMHTVMVGLGAAAVSTTGFTAATWIARYARYVRCASGLATEAERLAWLLQGDGWLRASLHMIDQLWRAAIRTTTPATTQWLHLLPFDCKMAEGMDSAEKMLEELKAKRHEFAWLAPPPAGPSNPYRFPLLSAHQPKPHTQQRQLGDRKQQPKDGKQVRGGEDRATASGQAVAPGSLASTWVYLPPPRQTDLLMGKTVWDTAAQAKHYKVTQKAKCWPLINSGRGTAKLMGQCDQAKMPGHKSLSEACHILNGYDREYSFQNFTRPATEEEKKLLEANQPARTTGGRRPAPRGATAGDSRRQRQGGGQPSQANERAGDGVQSTLSPASGAASLGLNGGSSTRSEVVNGSELLEAAAGERELTPRHTLSRSLQCLARRVAPHLGIIDCGGGGACGPLTAAFLLNRCGLSDDDGLTVRMRVVSHIQAFAHTLSFAEESASQNLVAVSLEDVVIASMSAWPEEALSSAKEVSVAEWVRIVSKPFEYTDAAFLCGVADCYTVLILLEAVDLHGARVPEACLRLSPCDGRRPRAVLRIGAVVQHHFVALVTVEHDPTSLWPRGGQEYEELGADPPPAPLPSSLRALVTICRSHVESWLCMTSSEVMVTEARILELSATEAVGADNEAEAFDLALAMEADHKLTSSSLLLAQSLSSDAANEDAHQDDVNLARGLSVSLAEEAVRGGSHPEQAEEARAFERAVVESIAAARKELGVTLREIAPPEADLVLSDTDMAPDPADVIVGDAGGRRSTEVNPGPGDAVGDCAADAGVNLTLSDSAAVIEPGSADEPVDARRRRAPARKQSVSWATELESFAAPPPWVEASDEGQDSLEPQAQQLPPSRGLIRAGDRPSVTAGGAEEAGHIFPLTTVEQVLDLLADSQWAPTDLVGCEFSGALRSALEREGRRAISADERDCDLGGMHFRGDVRLLLTLTSWERAYLFPPCSMTLRADEDCLQLKISDGRAFWGAAFVIFCWTVVTALVVVVEQPDTIVAGFYPLEEREGHYFEFRTTEYGEKEDKFVRLAVRNALIKPGSYMRHRVPQPHRSQFRYPDPDVRDRERSTWAPYVAVCQALASLTAYTAIHSVPPYGVAIRLLATRWHAAGYPVPVDYEAADAQPASQSAREYTRQRGPGDGRVIDTADPSSFGAAVSSNVPLHFELPPVPAAEFAAALARQHTPNAQYFDEVILSHGASRGVIEVDPTADVSGEATGDECVCCSGLGHIEGEECYMCDGSGHDREYLSNALGRLGASSVTVDPHTPAEFVDVRQATSAAVLLIYVCVLGQPLVYAHLDGFTMHGVELPEPVARSSCMPMVQQWVEAVTVAVHYAFLVGEYLAGARLFTAPLEYAPAPSEVVRTRAQRKRQALAGVTFAWCTLSALSGAPTGDAAWRAITAVQTFVKPVSQLADAPAADGQTVFRFGATPTRSLLRQPLLENEASPPLWVALGKLAWADRLLLTGLASVAADPLLSGWAERITPFDATSIPSSLVEALPDFSDPTLDTVLLSLVVKPLDTPWMPLPPRQAPPSLDAPLCPRSPFEFMLQETQEAVRRWLLATLNDLIAIREGVAAGIEPDEVVRTRPRPLAIGQSELHQWARGRVWDCRQECCVVADFEAQMSTHLNLDLIRTRLLYYPDQTLLANLLDGVRLDADVELQTVLVPHLTSLSKGYRSVEKELRRLHQLGWYDLFSVFPFWPMYLNGQGSTARKLEPDRFRRTTEGGGPRQPTFDLSGLAAISINAASRIHHLPQHFRQDSRPIFQEWLYDRGLLSGDCLLAKSKWPKEVKPQVCHLMRDLAVYHRASEILGEPVYLFGDDAKDYFNQLAMHPSELWKLGIVFLADEGELLSGADDESLLKAPGGRLVFVSEKRLGFGTHGASNLAQRFSDAILTMFREDMDAEEAVANAADLRPSMDRWRRARQQAQQASGEPCHPNRQWHQQEAVGNDHSLEVCPQARLYAVYMFTDDPLWVVVGVPRTLRALRVWRRLTDELGLIMAIPEKRTLGTWAGWIGVVAVSTLGLVVVPRDKLVRAVQAVERVLADTSEFGVYRSLVGLLEHIRQANLLGRNYMHGLYEPHGADGASQHGPSGVVVCSILMRKQLQRWRSLLFRAGGVSAKRALRREELEDAPSIDVEVSSDARRDIDLAGMGGFMHGSYWHWDVAIAHIPFLAIPILEFMALIMNLLTFGPVLLAASAAGSRLVVRTDALTAALTLPDESQRSPLLVAAYQWLMDQTIFQQLRPFIVVAHLFGDANPFSDYVSRAKWQELYRLCAQVGLKPVRIEAHSLCGELYQVIVERAQLQGPVRVPSRLSGLGRCGAGDGMGFLARMMANVSQPPPVLPPTSSAPPSSGFLARFSGQPMVASCTDGQSNTSLTPYLLPTTITLRHGSLLMPVMPVATRVSGLSHASRHFSEMRAAALAAAGPDPTMQLHGSVADMMRVGAAVQESVDFGINTNTLKKDERAWEFWELICEQQVTNPLRTAQEARDFPERNAHLLAVLMLHAFAVCRPQQRDRLFIKPRSALAYPLAIIRVFGRWGVPMPSYKMLKAALCGLLRLYLAYHGPYSLSPRRAEPMRFSMVRAMDAIKPSSRVSGLMWSDAEHDVFMFRRLSIVLIFTAFRLGEIVAHSSGEIMYLTFESLSWLIGGVVISDPTPDMLAKLRPGLDGALLAPPRSKPDQWGEIHCPFPAMLIYRTSDINAAAALRDIELKCRCRGAARKATPLFADCTGQPYTHSKLDRLLKAVLTFCFGRAVAAVFTWHSYRSGLATALHAAGVEDAMVQLICRWMCPESLHAYRRVGTREHDANIHRAAAVDVTTIQTTNVPRVMADAGFAGILHAQEGARGREEEKAFEEAKAAALREPSLAIPRPVVETTPTPTAKAVRRKRPMVLSPQRVLVPAAVYPTEVCTEQGGVGWEAAVISSTATTVKIEFIHARDASGSKFALARLPWRCVSAI